MDEEIESNLEPPKGIWSKIGTIVSGPVTTVSKMTKASPGMVLIAVLLIVQPIVQTSIDLVRELVEVKQDLNPDSRPVTKAELDILDSKIDFLEKLVITNTQVDNARLDRQDKWMDSRKPGTVKAPKATDPEPPPSSAPPSSAPVAFDALSKKLEVVEKKADANFEHQKK